LTVQKAPGASGPAQLLHFEKDAAPGPVTVPVKLSVKPPLLVIVNGWMGLVVPASWLPKDKLDCEKVIAGATPAPERLTDCGESLALSVRVKAAEAAPVAVGVKTMLTMHEAPGASGPAQLLHRENMDALLPVIAPLKLSVALPLLVKVTCCAALAVFSFWLPKLSVVVERVTAEDTPVPASETCCGESLALSVKVMPAEAAPAAVGLNTTLMVQEAPGASTAGLGMQLLHL